MIDQVYVPYCSSDLYRGTRDPIDETGNLTFHGKFIVEAVVKHLIQTEDLSQLSQFVLMGFSAGAFGTASNCDDVAAMVGQGANNGVDVRCVMDSPDFAPYWIHDEGCEPLENFKVATQFWQGKLVGIRLHYDTNGYDFFSLHRMNLVCERVRREVWSATASTLTTGTSSL